MGRIATAAVALVFAASCSQERAKPKPAKQQRSAPTRAATAPVEPPTPADEADDRRVLPGTRAMMVGAWKTTTRARTTRYDFRDDSTWQSYERATERHWSTRDNGTWSVREGIPFELVMKSARAPDRKPAQWVILFHAPTVATFDRGSGEMEKWERFAPADDPVDLPAPP